MAKSRYHAAIGFAGTSGEQSAEAGPAAMKKKRHPLAVPYTPGDLFAVQVVPGAWGYVRMRGGMGIEIPFVYTTTPGVRSLCRVTKNDPYVLLCDPCHAKVAAAGDA